MFKRKWLSGRASPCQGEGREFESRLPLHYCKKTQTLGNKYGTNNSYRDCCNSLDT